MNLIQLIRLILKNLKLVLTVPIVLVVLVTYLTRDQPKKYTSKTIIYTGIGTGYNLQSVSNSMFDFMRNKNLYIIDYHYYYRHPYKNVFLNAIKNKNNIYFVDIGMSNISNVDNNVLTLIYKYHGFKLYKINKTNEFISYLKN